MIVLEKVSKEFGKKMAVKNLSLAIEKGEVFGFLGPNGAGKTTTIKMILGLLRPTRGKILLFGKPADTIAARRKIGFLPESAELYPHLTGREFLEFVGEIFHFSPKDRAARAKRFLRRVNLPTGSWDRQIRTYSKGMRQRVALAGALINDPEILFLDEPMSGLDPIGRREMKEIILDLKKKGTTIFFNSHILADAAEICDRVGILHLGNLLLEGAVSKIVPRGKTLEDRFIEVVSGKKTAARKSKKSAEK